MLKKNKRKKGRKKERKRRKKPKVGNVKRNKEKGLLTCPIISVSQGQGPLSVISLKTLQCSPSHGKLEIFPPTDLGSSPLSPSLWTEPPPN